MAEVRLVVDETPIFVEVDTPEIIVELAGSPGPPGKDSTVPGPSGPSTVSTDPDNSAVIGTDGYIYVPPVGDTSVDEVYVGPTPPAEPFDGQMWVDTTGEGSGSGGGSGGGGSGVPEIYVSASPPPAGNTVLLWVDVDDTSEESGGGGGGGGEEGAPITVRDYVRGFVNGSGSTLTMTTPGAVEGDLLVALVAHQGGSIATTNTPSGWTLITASSGQYAAWSSFYKVQPAGGQFSVTFDANNNTNAITAAIWSVYGHTTTRSPIGYTVGELMSNTTTHVAPAVMTTAVNSLMLANYFTYGPWAPTPTVLNGWTPEIFAAGATFGSYGAARIDMPAIGTAGAFTFVTSNSVGWLYHQVEVLSSLAYP